MQLDMHYYGTYALARAAGLKQEVCAAIAAAAQFVDDNADKACIEFADEAHLDVEATAHHTVNLKNIDPEDQRQIWVPFHFLPGNVGDTYRERLVCIKDSRIARKLIELNLKQLAQPFALQLLGITAHVYADTFSHYGFSGISARENRVVGSSLRFYGLAPEMEAYITRKAEKFRWRYRQCSLKQAMESRLAELFSRALGHGAVMTYPDRPYLKWDFVYENTPGAKRCLLRDNPATYLECCSRLHALFERVAKARDEFSEPQSFRDFSQIAATVRDILELQAPLASRIAAWQDAARQGRLFGTGAETIPEYPENAWLEAQAALTRTVDSRSVSGLTPFRFYQAATVHRNNVIRYLLPSQGLLVA